MITSAIQDSRSMQVMSNQDYRELFKTIPQSYKQLWLKNNPNINDPYSRREFTRIDEIIVAKEWTTYRHATVGDPFHNHQMQSIDTGPRQSAMTEMTSTNSSINDSIIRILRREFPKEEAFLRAHSESRNLNPIEGIVSVINMCIDARLDYKEDEGRILDINKELRDMEDKKNELHNRSTSGNQQRAEQYRNGEAARDTAAYAQIETRDRPF